MPSDGIIELDVLFYLEHFDNVDLRCGTATEFLADGILLLSIR